MEAGLESYRDRFASVRVGLTAEVARGMTLIEEILGELESTKSILKETELDLENECEARRRLQEMVQENRKLAELQGRWPFVVALIDADADCYVFHDKFITRGEKGGEDAADALLAALQQFMQSLPGGQSEADILVKAYANFNGLGSSLQREKRLKDKDQLRTFAAGFSSRQAFFDFVDVGSGKERADLKVQESIKFFLESYQCKHLVLACGHDDGYAPWLGQFVGDKQVAERITLVEGCPFPVKMRNLGLKTTQFSSVFNQVARSAAPRARDTPATVPDISAENISSSKLPKAMGAAISGAIAGQNPRAQSDRLRPVLNSQSGRRIDKPLLVDRAIVDRIKKASLCYYFYLRGQCIMPCRRNHDYRALTDEEFDALWDQARQGKCLRSTKVDRKGGEDCSDVMCVYGHTKDAQMVA